jgi:hypothetical protein
VSIPAILMTFPFYIHSTPTHRFVVKEISSIADVFQHSHAIVTMTSLDEVANCIVTIVFGCYDGHKRVVHRGDHAATHIADCALFLRYITILAYNTLTSVGLLQASHTESQAGSLYLICGFSPYQHDLRGGTHRTRAPNCLGAFQIFILQAPRNLFLPFWSMLTSHCNRCCQ